MYVLIYLLSGNWLLAEIFRGRNSLGCNNNRCINSAMNIGSFCAIPEILCLYRKRGVDLSYRSFFYMANRTENFPLCGLRGLLFNGLMDCGILCH
ncbi:hypothetical protein BDV37DRAFT_53581 [Aspergillus pseudonomiae]|uniref:Uncharacterized protein n=1 Tax=Aspergillus pseudonomiae TaxID=1506151 RepID=A0A5N7CUB1_9EURO|nr:uncharacterized protein BDV37DRAFT_53581 [Aspergillus pseudonomiae]KAE8397569.1 hypothetical protein BDV37DRAFT_53581 [Aspergillus pseudonomiae]